MAKDHQNWWSFFVGLMGSFAQKVSTWWRFSLWRYANLCVEISFEEMATRALRI